MSEEPEPYNFSKEAAAAVMLVKLELNRLAKRVSSARNSELDSIFLLVTRNDVISLAAKALNAAPAHLRSMHEAEVEKLHFAICESTMFTGAQKSFMLLQLATYSREPTHLLTAISSLGAQLLQNYRLASTSSDMSDLAVTEMLQEVKRSREPWRSNQEFFYARTQM